MPTILDPLHLLELSLVDKGANEDAKITIFKVAQNNSSRIDLLAERVNKLRVRALSARIQRLKQLVS